MSQQRTTPVRRPNKAVIPATDKYVGVGFIYAYRASEQYMSVVNADGSTYALPKDVFDRTCSEFEPMHKYIVVVDEEGKLCIEPYTEQKSLWERIKAVFGA